MNVRPCPDSSHWLCMKGSLRLGPACLFSSPWERPVCSEPVLARYESRIQCDWTVTIMLHLLQYQYDNFSNYQFLYGHVWCNWLLKLKGIVCQNKTKQKTPTQFPLSSNQPWRVRRLQFCTGTSRLMSQTSKATLEYLSIKSSDICFKWHWTYKLITFLQVELYCIICLTSRSRTTSNFVGCGLTRLVVICH